jgi:hypothetical protein
MPPSRNASGKGCRSRLHCPSAKTGRRPPSCHVLVRCGWGSAVSQRSRFLPCVRELPFEIRSRRSDRSNMFRSWRSPLFSWSRLCWSRGNLTCLGFYHWNFGFLCEVHLTLIGRRSNSADGVCFVKFSRRQRRIVLINSVFSVASCSRRRFLPLLRRGNYQLRRSHLTT